MSMPGPRRRLTKTESQAAAHKADLQVTFRAMDAEAAQDIRSSYYDASCGLDSLVRGLELQVAEFPHLAAELAIAKAAVEVMNKCRLGAVL